MSHTETFTFWIYLHVICQIPSMNELDDAVMSARDAYKALQQSGSANMSSAVNRSSQLFQRITSHPGPKVNTNISKCKPVAIAEQALKQSLGIVTADKPCTNPVSPLLGEDTHDAQFLCLVTELMKPGRVN